MNRIQHYIDSCDFSNALKFAEEAYMRKNNSDDLLNIVLLLIRTPLQDSEKAYSYLNSSLLNNFGENLFILKCFIELRYFGGLSDESMKIVQHSFKLEMRTTYLFFYSEHIQYNSAKNEFSKDIYFEVSNSNIHFVNAHFQYLKLNKDTLSNIQKEECFKKIINGIEKVYEINEPVDILDFESFYKESILGSYLSVINFQDKITKALSYMKCNM